MTNSIINRMSQTIAVVVLNWNGKSLLQTYLPGVIKDSAPHKVYVIDNDSSDDSLAYLKENHPEVVVIQTGENLGYAGGYNEGLKAIQEPISILLNSDVRTTPGLVKSHKRAFRKSSTMRSITA